jgi:hypothetical protein
MEEQEIPQKKTEYRIIPIETFIADQYLQFKRTIDGDDKWCFIPKIERPKVLGQFLTQEECPTELPKGSLAADFLHCFNDHQDYELVPFAKNYPDINLYFEELNLLRQEYLKKKEDQKNFRNNNITYL